jgi:phospholipase/carboxylesterase
MGFQWFPIPWLDAAGEGLPAERIALVGFSQGTMMALQVGLRRRAALAGIVGFSGRLLRPEKLAAEIVTKPPVLLIHGDEDPVVPVSSLQEAGDALVGAGVETYARVSKGVGHSIAPDGLGLALGFLRAQLGYDAPAS